MRKLLFSMFLLLTCITNLLGQQTRELSDDQPVNDNGMIYGYRIRNETTAEAKGDEYSRFEIEVYITNNSGCPKILMFKDLRPMPLGGGSSENHIANFQCLNATGKRMTSKAQLIDIRPFSIQYKVEQKAPDGKITTSFATAQVGYAINNGETVARNVIVITPLGEKPRFQVSYLTMFSIL